MLVISQKFSLYVFLLNVLAATVLSTLVADSLDVQVLSPRADMGKFKSNGRYKTEGWWANDKVGATCAAETAVNAGFATLGWRFTVELKGWESDGRSGSGCGGGYLDNLRGDCKGAIITDWKCRVDNRGIGIASFITPKTLTNGCIESAMTKASLGAVKGVKCGGLDFAKDAISTGFSVGTSFIPTPGGAVASAAGAAIKAGVKAGVGAAVKAVGKVAVKAGISGAKTAGKGPVKQQVQNKSKGRRALKREIKRRVRRALRTRQGQEFVRMMVWRKRDEVAMLEL